MVLKTPISTFALPSHKWHCRHDVNAEAGSSMTRGVSVLSSDLLSDGDSDIDSYMTDATLVEGKSAIVCRRGIPIGD